jgi:hypothetical protein
MSIRVKQAFFFYMCLILKLRIYSQGNFVFDSANVQINSLNINTKESEFGPFKVDNRLFYTSSRERRIGVINLDRATSHQMLDLYVGELRDSVTVTGRTPLRNKVNNSLNQGSAFFDKQSSKLYYAGNVTADGGTENYKLAIFSTELKDNKFLKPRIELILPDNALASHPMVYRNKLYFSSNMKGGKGKADLYVADQVEGKWTNIRNLDQLNSPYDDYFPFVINDSEIYFSSNRPGGFGKLDLYKYEVDGKGISVKNLGKPVNSGADDYAIYMDPAQDKGYFSTNRNGDQDDIYYFKKVWPSFNNCIAAIREKYCYDFSDEKSLDTDSLKGYFYEWDFGDGTRQKGISTTHCYLEPGNYTINLNIIDVSTKAVFLNQTSVELKVDSIVQLKINALDTMLVNKKFTVNTLGTYLPDKKILGCFFEVDGKRMRSESFEYSFAKTGNYKIKLGVEFEDLEAKTKGLLCTTMDVTCVDSTSWLPFEQRQLDAVASKFKARNIASGKSGLEEMNFDAELSLNGKKGLSRDLLAEKIDDYLAKNLSGNKDGMGNMSEDAELAMKQKSQGKDDPNAKNLGNNKSGLGNMDEEAELAFKKKQQEVKDAFYKNLGNNKDGLGGMNEDAELAFKKKQQEERDAFYKNLGNNKDGLTAMDEEAELAFKKKQQEEKDAFYKNLGNNKNGLGGMNEDAELAFRKKQQEEKDAFYKNLGNNKDGLGGMNEEAELALKKKQQEEKDAFYKNLGNNKDGLGGMNEDAELAFNKKQQEEKDAFYKNLKNHKNGLKGQDEEAELALSGKDGEPVDGAGKKIRGQKSVMNEMEEDAELVIVKNPNVGRNLKGRIDTLLNLNEDASISFRVHLGISRVHKDTTILNSRGMYGIKEELIDDQYHYTFGNEKKVNNIEKYYRKAVNYGVKEPVIIAYKNNLPIANQARNFKPADFGERKEKPLTVKEKLMAIFKKKPKEKEDTLVAVKEAPKVEKPAEQPLVADAGKTPPVAEAKKKPVVRDSSTRKTQPVAAPPEVAVKEPVKGKPEKTPPPDPEPEKDAYLNPVPRKPDDVKLVDARTPADITVSAKVSLNEFVEKFGDASAPDLQFRVQISAFKYRNRYEFPHLANLGVIENTLTEGGITRITIGGQFDTYKKALEHTKKVISAGQKDAFVTAFFKGKRVYVENLEKMGIFVTK